mmetsp:Transcript_77728/g.107504  ORF Transcript_77728/g.107504 Transcript_77728/m.107504 type:complete len:113 (+) Transcript_77728:3-341(+)
MTPVSFSSKLQARRAALEWYCVEKKAEHKGELPCINQQYTSRMGKASTDEERKTIMLQRSTWVAKQERKGKREPSALKTAYVTMYRAYCEAKFSDKVESCIDEAIHGTTVDR